MKHDAVVRAVRAAAKRVDRKEVASAFVASLAVPSPEGPWWAALVALAAAQAVPLHKITATFSGGSCKECGLDTDVELEPLDDGEGCLPGDLACSLVALRGAARHEPPEPTRQDVKRLARILAIVGELPDAAREGQLNQAIAKEKLVVGGKYTRRHVIETLGACGILETPEHPGFTTRWTTFAARQDRPSVRVECDPPIAFWTAAHGVSAKNVEHWFGHLGVRVPRASRPRPGAVAKKSAASARSAARAARVTEYVVGDAVAFALGKRWIAAIVVDRHTDKGGTVPIVEVVDWVGPACPTERDLRGKRARGTRWGKSMMCDRLWMYRLFARDDPKGRWKWVGSGFPAPDASHLEPPLGLGTISRVDEIENIAKSAELV
jgi:hypothetical protein